MTRNRQQNRNLPANNVNDDDERSTSKLDPLDGVEATDQEASSPLESQAPIAPTHATQLSPPQPTMAAATAIPDDADPPTFPAFLAGPKTIRPQGDGPQGRPWVYSAYREGGEVVRTVRRPRAGDEERPLCPGCSTDQVAVLCGAISSPTDPSTGIATRNLKCPCCSFSVQRLRAGVAEQLLAGKLPRSKRSNGPFVDRQ